MDGVYKELDELKAELEKLKEQYRIKTELSESLRRAHTEQLAKSQEAKLQIEKQTKELNDKSEELAELRQLYGQVKSKLLKTESSFKQVSSVNEKIRVDTTEKVQKLEKENRKLVSALEDATGRNDDLEMKLCTCNKEVEGLKNLLSESQRRCLEVEEKARAGRELRHREEVISKLEEQSMSIQDQLKWKKEQFEHLKEAHTRLQDLFQSSKKEWASEKSDMLEEITALQSKLDAQIRITESLECRLKMCNQALAHEESRRKGLEVQLSESKQCFDNVLAECEEAKAKIESLSNKQEEAIADLRNSLGMKEILLKEMEYKATHLEQDNKELLGSLKELQESQINKRKVDPSLNKLRNKLKDLQQVHNNCSLALKEKEAEWNMKMEKLMSDMNCYESDLKKQSEQLEHLKMQLDNCHSAMELSGEETSILLLMMKSELSDAYSKLFKSEDQTEAFKKEKKNAISAHYLQVGDYSLSKSQVQVQQVHEEIALMAQKLESMKFLEERSTFLESALFEHKKLLGESSDCQLRLKEQVSQMEVVLSNLSTALEKSNSELAAKIQEATQTEMELHVWKCKAESIKTCLEQSQEVCQKMEKTLLEQVDTEQSLRKENESFQSKMKEQDLKIEHLQQKTVSLNQKLLQNEAATEAMRLELEEAQGLRKENESFQCKMKEEEQKIEDLQQKTISLDQQLRQKEAATEAMRLEMEKVQGLRKEKESFQKKIKEQEQKIEDLQQKTVSLDQKLIQKEVATEAMRLEVEEAQKKNEHYIKMLKERDATVENLQKEMVAREEQSMRREAAAESSRLEAQNKFQFEKEELCRTITAQKDEQIRCIQDFASSLEQEFMELVLFSLSQGVENMVKIVALEDALEKSEFSMKTEIERKNIAIHALTEEVSNLHGRMLLQGESLLQSQQSVKELEALIEFQKEDTEKLLKQLRENQAKLKELVKRLEHENEASTASIKRLSFERDNLVSYLEGFCEQFGDFCTKEVKFERMLEEMLQNSDKDDMFTSDVISDKLTNPASKDVKVLAICDRSPLKEINHY